MANTRRSKYLKNTPRKPQTQAPTETKNNMENTEKPNNQVPETPTEKTIHEQHKEFVKAAESSVKNTNEPVLETTFKKTEEFVHPYAIPVIEREYTTQGIKKEPTTAQPSSTGSASSQQASAPSSDAGFEPTPPPIEDDPNYAGEHKPDETTGVGGEGMNIPAGSAGELVDWGAKSLNFVIGNFAGLLINLKIKPEYHSIRDNRQKAVDIISEFNTKNVEKLKLDADDIAMLKPPLVKLLQEKGIRGLTPAEELMLAIALIAAKKVKAIAEMKSESKKLQAHFDSMIKYMKGNNDSEPTNSTNKESAETEYQDVTVEEL